MFCLLHKHFACLKIARVSVRPVHLIFSSQRLAKNCFLYVKICRHVSSNNLHSHHNLVETTSRRIKIPRFMRKSNDKAQIERYRLMKSLCLERKFDKALLQMMRWLEEPVANFKSTILILNGLLYSLYEESKHEGIAMLKDIMDKLNISGDRSTYTVLIDSYGKTNNAEMVFKLLEEMTSLGLVPHERSYMIVTRLSIEGNKLLKALEYFEKLESLQKERHDSFCAWFIASMSQESQYIERMFKDFRDNQTRIGEKMLAEIIKYFESGVCLNCERKLERPRFGKQQEQLQSYFQNLVKQKLNADGSTSLCSNITIKDEQKIMRLVQYLKSNGPFDVIVDGLNVAMHPSRGLNFYHLYRLAEYFWKQDKRVLIVAANDLISPKRSSASALTEHQNAMRNIRQVSNIYLVKESQSGIDDVFLILAALFSFRNNPDVQLVSDDRFMDHRHNMKPQTACDFERWLHTHQVLVKRFGSSSGIPHIQDRRLKYAIVVQRTRDSWHFPSTDGKTWLCVKKRSSS